MALPDNHLDAFIEAALQRGTNVSAQQKQIAWERLSQKASIQLILPATLTTPEKSFMARLVEIGGVVWRQFSSFAIEEDRYERARHNRNMLRYSGMTRAGEISIQFETPLRKFFDPILRRLLVEMSVAPLSGSGRRYYDVMGMACEGRHQT